MGYSSGTSTGVSSQNQSTLMMDGGNDSQENQYKQVELSLGDKLRGLFSAGPFKKGEFIVMNDHQGIRDAIYSEF